MEILVQTLSGLVALGVVSLIVWWKLHHPDGSSALVKRRQNAS